jgi:murein DD-endopeptidase MepM/ murein hydrolase activator NlpD
MENRGFMQKMKDVFKRYSYYFVLGGLLLVVAVTMIIVGLSSSNQFEDETIPTNTIVSPYLPVLNASIYKGYYADELVYNTTLKQWETHNAIDFVATNGSKVYSILDGKVKSVYSNLLEGQVIVIEHEDGLVSTYGSLAEDVKVKEGDLVNRGQEIGSVSDSSTGEVDAGAHLHFSLTDNGNNIDPAAYLNIETK